MTPLLELIEALRRCQGSCKASLEILHPKSSLDDVELPTDPSGQPLTVHAITADFLSLLQMLYSHATRISLAIKPPSTPAAAIKCLSDLSTDVTRIVLCAASVVTPGGATLSKEFVWGTQEVCEGIIHFLEGLLDENEKDDKAYLRRMGVIHATIDKVKTSLSNTNLEAVAKRWKSHSESLQDALKEVKEMAEDQSGDDEDDGWDELMGDGALKETASREEAERIKQVSQCF